MTGLRDTGNSPLTAPREALELALRSILDDDDAVSAAGIVLDEGWLPPSEVLTAPRDLAQTIREQLKHPILHRFEHTGTYLEMSEGEQSPLYKHEHSKCSGCAAEVALDDLVALAESRSVK